MQVVVQLEYAVPVAVIGHSHQQVVGIAHCLKTVLHAVLIALLHLAVPIRLDLLFQDPVSIGIIGVFHVPVMLPVVFPDLHHLVRCIVGVLRTFLHASVPRLAVEDTVSHVVIFEHIVIPALAVLILGCGQEPAVIIVCEGTFRLYDLEVVDTVLVMFVDMLVAVREQVIVPALMLPVMLVIPGIRIQAFNRVLRHDEPAVIIGVIIPADNPSAFIAPVDHGYNLVPGIVGVVGIHPIRAVDFRHTVDGIIYIGGDGAGSVCHLCQVVILIVFITDTLPIRIGDALQLVTSVIGIGGDLTGAGGHLGNPSKPVIFITAVTSSVHHGDTPAQDIIAINHTFIYGIALPVLIGFLPQAVEDIVIIGYLLGWCYKGGFRVNADRVFPRLTFQPFAVRFDGDCLRG